MSEPDSRILNRQAQRFVRKDLKHHINIQAKSEAPEQIHVDTVLGVDLGITDIAVTSEGQKFGGKTIKLIKNHYVSLMRAVLQQKAVKGTRSSRRRCRELQQRLSGKQARYQRQINHEISKAIVTRAQEIPAKIALEDLTGIREGVNQKAGKNHRRKVSGWAFYQLKEFLSYKALAAGVPLVLVDPAYSSQTCHQCGEHGIRNGKSFKCPVCGWSGDADFPWKTKKNQMQEASYPPPSDDLFWSGLFTEISSSARKRAFFRLLSLIP
ncbi:transposase [Methanothrix soehngenii]|uniref:RNA-guided endonuclease InsQ/TnpB family protein n=1 Tax=Methanothrix soehngenii TaxID=2223 RepID=UPI00300C3D00